MALLEIKCGKKKLRLAWFTSDWLRKWQRFYLIWSIKSKTIGNTKKQYHYSSQLALQIVQYLVNYILCLPTSGQHYYNERKTGLMQENIL